MALWNECLPKDPITIERFWRLFLLDANFRAETMFVAVAHGQPIGFLQAMVRRTPIGIFPSNPQHGWITAFCVAPEHRRRGIGRALMEAGMDVLAKSGCKAVSCNGYAPSYAFPGVDVDYVEGIAFMEAMGFQPSVQAVRMAKDLAGVTTPDDVSRTKAELESQGFSVRLFQDEDTVPLLKFAEEQFPYWHQSLVDGLQQKSSNVWVASYAGSIVGFAQWQNPQTDPPNGASGRFGPFGVDPSLRGKGLGGVIFYTLVEDVIRRGAKHLWFGWAGGRNLSFYERVGCQVTRRYQMFKQEI